MNTTTITITGMTCEHCVRAVRSEVSELPGVESVEVHLVTDGASTATVSSSGPLDPAAVEEAVQEAGYSLVGISG